MTVIAYHGSDFKFNKFDKAKLGQANGPAPINMLGFNFTDSESVAKTFGKYIYLVNLEINTPLIIDAKGKSYSEFKHLLNTKIAKNLSKYDGIIIKNYKDAGAYSRDYIKSNHYIVFDASQIKILKMSKRSTLTEKILREAYDFKKIPIEVTEEDYNQALLYREDYFFNKLGIGRFLSTVILWRVIDEFGYQYLQKRGYVSSGQFSVKAERSFGPSFTGSREDAIDFGTRWRKSGRLVGDLYLIGINAEDKRFLNLNMEERMKEQGLDYNVGVFTINSSLGDTGLGFSVNNVMGKDILFIYKINEDGSLTEID